MMALLYLPGDLARYLESKNDTELHIGVSLASFLWAAPYGYYRYLRAGISLTEPFFLFLRECSHFAELLASLPEFKPDLVPALFSMVRDEPDEEAPLFARRVRITASMADLKRACLELCEPRLYRFILQSTSRWECESVLGKKLAEFKFGSVEHFYDLHDIPLTLCGYLSHKNYEKWKACNYKELSLVYPLLASNWKLAERVYQNRNPLIPSDLIRLKKGGFTNWAWLVERSLVTQASVDAWARLDNLG